MSDENEFEVCKQEIVDRVVRSLRNGGLTENDTAKIMEKTLAQAKKNKKKFSKMDQLYSACIRNMGPGNFMKKTTQGGAGGVTMMTSVASEKLDEAAKSRGKVQPRTARGNIFNPKTGEIT